MAEFGSNPAICNLGLKTTTMYGHLVLCFALHGIIHSDGLDIKIQRVFTAASLPIRLFELSKTSVSILQVRKLGLIECE